MGKDMYHIQQSDLHLAYEQYFNASNACICIIDKHHNIIKISKNCRTLLGLSRQKIKKTKCYDVLNTPICHTIQCPLKNCTKRKTIIELETVKKDKKGNDLIFQITALPYFNKKGKLLGIIEILKNITEIKKWEAELQIKNMAIENSINAFAIFTLDDTITYVNDAFLRLFKYSSKDQVIDKRGRDIWANPEEAIGIFSDIKEKGKWVGELSTKTQTNIPLIIQLNGYLLKDENDQPMCAVAFCTDITKEKKVEASLAKSESNYRSLVNNSPIGIITVDQKGYITNVNPMLLKILGSPSAQATKQINLLTFPPLIKAGISADFAKCLKTGEVKVCENPYTTKWGKTTYLRYRLNPIKNSKGKIVLVQGVVEDISEYKQAQEKFEQLFNNADDIILIYSLQGKILEVNKSTCEKLGFTRAELLKMNIKQLTTADNKNKYCWPLEQIPINNCLINETVIKSKKGKIFPIELNLRIIDYLNESAFFAIARDITTRYLTELEKEKVQEQLIQSEKLSSLGQLAGGVAHEINNPLTTVLGFTQLLISEMDRKNPYYNDLKTIEESALRCKKIVASLLTYSRKQTYDFTKININKAIENVLNLIGHQIELEKIKIYKTLNRHIPPVSGNQQKIEQVLVNLILNAKDAMPNGGKLTIQTKLQKKHVLVSISDTGSGIAPEIMNKIFDPFFTTKPPDKGTGLGLSICVGIITQHHGKLKVKKNKDKSTTFTFSLPVSY